MFSSAAIALSTLPLPPESHSIYPFAGPSYGSELTCEIQGFVNTLGNCMVLLLGLILNIYYVCKLRYDMEDEKFSKFIEPVLYTLSFSSTTSISILVWLQDGYNPTPHDPYCGPREYPMKCTLETDPDCRGSATINGVNPIVIAFIVVVVAFVALIISMGLITTSYVGNERKIMRHLKTLDAPTDEEMTNSANGLQYNMFEEKLKLQHARASRKAITRQAILYLSAFLLTWTWFIVEVITRNHNIIAMLRFVLQPSQGLFNLMIFLYHKVDVAMKDDEDLTLWEALQRVLRFPQETSENLLLIHNLEFIGAWNISNVWAKASSYNMKEDKPVDMGNSKGSIKEIDPDLSYASPHESSKLKSLDGFGDISFTHSDPDRTNVSPSEANSKSLGGFDGISFAEPSISSSKVEPKINFQDDLMSNIGTET